MGKSLRRVQRKLDARVKACIEARNIAILRNPKLRATIDLAYKMPGSRKPN